MRTSFKGKAKMNHNIDDEQLWLKTLEDRNIRSHTYREKISNEVSKRVQSEYKDVFDRL